ncbi:flagellar assembly protein A [Sporosarcina sp. FA9]|uniref:flagellar assembly protein A n=1 Tax=Sporosarcina sp. FA9 TaxID=3413030 RepID=UPI003F65EEF6
MQYVVSKGKNVDEAVNLGLKLMDIQKHKVNIEVVKQGKERFWKVLSKEAVVKLTKNEEKKRINSLESLVKDFFEADEKKNPTSYNTELTPEITTDTLEGKVWIQDGKIICKTSEDKYPTLEVPKNLTVLINGKPFNGKSLVLSEKERYEIRLDIVEEEMRWEITMDAQKNKALLRVEPGYKIEYNVLDTEPAQHTKLTVVENKQVQNTLEFDEVIKKMGSMGINYGFNYSEIMKASVANESENFIIAEGKLPDQGKNGWLEIKVDTKVQVGPRENEDGRVDFREIKSTPHVDKGQLIGIIHPPIVGKIGNKITNEPIPVKQTFPLKVHAGKGIAVIEDKIIAKESGRPKIDSRGLIAKVSIIPKLIHVGNVDLASGNITFKGDVEIYGEVFDQMSVDAIGDIEIHKAVNSATITSSRGVTLHRNSNGSKITAGNLKFTPTGYSTQLESIIETVDEIIELLGKLTSSDNFKSSEYSKGSIQPLIRSLIGRKFPEFPIKVKKFVELISDNKIPVESEMWSALGISLSQQFLSLSPGKTPQESLGKLLNDMQDHVERTSETMDGKAYITAPNAMNSSLYCSGDISITGHGCINTIVQAEGYVQVNGILRGGEVYGGLGVNVGEAGSISSSATVISVPHNQTIRIDKALEGVILKVGQNVYKFTEPVFHVRAHINSKDKLIVDYSKNK